MKKSTLLERVSDRQKKVERLIETISSAMIELGITKLSIELNGSKGNVEMKSEA